MKELFIVRTGDHDDLGEENLSSYGERQINRLAKK